MAETLALDGKLDLAAVADLHAAVMARSGKDVLVDFRAVSHLGALCLQVLICAGAAARAKGTAFTLQNIPDQVLAQMAAMGLSPETIERGGT